MTGATTPPPSDRSLRGWLVVIGLPLAATLGLPWPHRWSDTLFAWEIAEKIDTFAPVVLPGIGVLLVLLGLVRPIPARLRAALAGVAAMGVVYCLVSILTVPRYLRGLDGDLDGAPFLGLVVAPLLATLFELFLHLDKRSRARAALAALGWAHLLARFFVPLRSDRVESMPFLVATEAVADGDGEAVFLLATPLAVLGMLGLLGFVSASIRALSSAEKRPLRRFRRPWLAWSLGFAPPLVFGGILVLGAIANDGRFFFAAGLAFAYALAATLGVPLFLARTLSAASEVLAAGLRSEDPRVRKRLRMVLAGSLGLLACFAGYRLYRALGPDPRDEALSGFLSELAADVVASSMGQPFDDRFLGGYSELDLRGSVGTLAESVRAGTAVEVEMVALELVTERGAVVEAVSVDGSRARYAGVVLDTDGPMPIPVPDAGRLADGLAAGLSRVNEGIASAACLPAVDAEDLEGLPPDARDRAAHADALADACEGGPATERRRLVDLLDDRIHGAARNLEVFVRAGERRYVLSAHVYVDQSRLWVGRATATAL